MDVLADRKIRAFLQVIPLLSSVCKEHLRVVGT
jgi:hypothetical protein